jgi:mannose-6-phosphate isomerase-like protein (cupin superfamily)
MKQSMRVMTMLLCASVLLAASNALAQKKATKNVMLMASEDMKWTEMKGGPPGINYCNIKGDMMKGAYSAMVKLPANMSNPLHTHSSDTKVVVVAGAFYVKPEGGTEKVLGPGSYFTIPAGVKHFSGTKGDGAMVYQEGTGKFDLVPVEAPKK